MQRAEDDPRTMNQLPSLLRIITAHIKVLQGQLAADRGEDICSIYHSPLPTPFHRSRCIMLNALPYHFQLTWFGIRLGQSERIGVLISGFFGLFNALRRSGGEWV